MGIMYIGLTTFAITASADIEASVPETPQVEADATLTTPTVTPAATPTEAPAPNTLEPASKEVANVVERYMNALLTADPEDFRGLVNDSSLLDFDEIQKLTEAVRAYENIEVYTKKGDGIIDYVAFVTYETLIPTIETHAFSIDSLYITHGLNGEPLVFLGDMDKELFEELEELKYDEDVQKLMLDVNSKMIAAIESDEDLKAFVDKLQDIPEGDSEG